MPDYLTYDGQILTWWPLDLRFKATSGLPDYQKPEDQWIKAPDNPDAKHPDMAGPIPEGTYFLLLTIDPHVYAVGGQGGNPCALVPSTFIQQIPRKYDPAHWLEPNLLPEGQYANVCEGTPETGGWRNWGIHRVRIDPDKKTSEYIDKMAKRFKTGPRGGFYLHDSGKGYSHGCIEVEGKFFPKLLDFVGRTKQKRMKLIVKYTAPTTYGNTKVNEP